MPVVTVSRLLGTSGDAIAEGVARALDARLVDKASLGAAARQAGLSAAALAEIQADEAQGLVERTLTMLRALPVVPRSRGGSLLDAAPLALPHEGTLTLGPDQVHLDDSVRLLERVIRSLAAEGNIVIVGRAGHAVLRDHPTALHVQVVASLAARVAALAAEQDLDKRAALARVRASDRARGDYVRRYYNVGWCESWHYDLVINSARVPVAVAVELIVAAARARQADERTLTKDE